MTIECLLGGLSHSQTNQAVIWITINEAWNDMICTDNDLDGTNLTWNSWTSLSYCDCDTWIYVSSLNVFLHLNELETKIRFNICVLAMINPKCKWSCPGDYWLGDEWWLTDVGARAGRGGERFLQWVAKQRSILSIPCTQPDL